MNASPHKRLLIFGSIYFIIYLIGAVVFYKERIFLDGAYYFFHVVQSQNFHVEHQRFILIPSQLLAWIGVQLHLKLKFVMILNSINPVLYLSLFFLICTRIFKDEAAGWALLFAGVCGVYFIYFVPMYEVWYGSVLLIFFSSMMQQEYYRTPLQLIILGCVVITLLFSYPLMIIGFLFFSIYHFASIKRIPIKVAALFLAIVIFWLIWKSLFISDYENGKISYPFSRIGTTIKENFTPISNIGSLLFFLFSVYFEAMVMMLLTMVVLVLKKNYLKAGLIIGVTFGFVLLINTTHSYPWNHSNYFERMYLLLIPLCMLPFLREVHSFSRRKMIFEILFFIILFFRGLQIFKHSVFYSDRIEKVEAFVKLAQQQGGSKFYVNGEQYPDDPALNEWSFPMEALLYSSLLHSDHTVTISLKNDLDATDVESFLNDQSFHLRLNEVRHDAWLNKNYFYLQYGKYEELE